MRQSALLAHANVTGVVLDREDGWKLLQEDLQKGLQWVFKCLLEIIYALEYLQSLSVIHGDLKCANVLCKSSTSDFRGFTCKYDSTRAIQMHTAMMACIHTRMHVQACCNAHEPMPDYCTKGIMVRSPDTA